MADARIVITAETQQAQVAIANLNRSLGRIDRSTAQAQKGLSGLANTSKMLVGALAAVTAGIGIREIVDYTARWTDLNSRLINATGSSVNAKLALDAISASARTTFSSLEQTAETFLRNSMALNELGFTTNEQIRVSTALNNAMAISGARGDQAASALDAFSKAMARGKFEGEDMNRILENSDQLAKALADGLGVTTGELRKMVTDGLLTSEKAIQALNSQFDILEQKATDMPATITDGFVLINNSLFEFIGRLDQSLGISEALAGSLAFLADNIHIAIGAIAGIGVAVLALTVKMIGLATAVTIATGGLALIAAGGVGAALAVAAKEAGLFAFMTDKATDPATELATAAADSAAAKEREVKAAQKLLIQQRDALKPLFEKLTLERESIGLNQTEVAIKKNLLDATKALEKTGLRMTDAIRDRIVSETRSLHLAKEKQQLDQALQDLQTEMIGLLVQDADLREVVLAVREQELSIGRELTQQERNRLTSTLQMTQALREQASIKDAIAEATRQQTQLEKIQRGISLQGTLNPSDALQKQFDRDLAALTAYHKQVGTSEADALTQRLALEEQFTFSKLELQNQEIQNYGRINQLKEQMDLDRINRTLMAEQAGSAAVLSTQDQAILQRQGAEQRQRSIVADRIEFEKKSELEKTTFALDNMQTVFAALGQQNKKAFEASKALAIASALVNTYQAATKALATFPFPFGLIAAAGAVAAGMAQVSAIRSQQYSGRQLGGPVMGNKSFIVGENGPEMFTPTTNGSVVRNGDLPGGGATNISFTIVANDAQGFDDLLSARKGMIKQMISDAMIERGQRSMI